MTPVRLNPWPLGLESRTLPLSHCALPWRCLLSWSMSLMPAASHFSWMHVTRSQQLAIYALAQALRAPHFYTFGLWPAPGFQEIGSAYSTIAPHQCFTIHKVNSEFWVIFHAFLVVCCFFVLFFSKLTYQTTLKPTNDNLYKGQFRTPSHLWCHNFEFVSLFHAKRILYTLIWHFSKEVNVFGRIISLCGSL